jgi:hypothetical protein
MNELAKNASTNTAARTLILFFIKTTNNAIVLMRDTQLCIDILLSKIIDRISVGDDIFLNFNDISYIHDTSVVICDDGRVYSCDEYYMFNDSCKKVIKLYEYLHESGKVVVVSGLISFHAYNWHMLRTAEYLLKSGETYTFSYRSPRAGIAVESDGENDLNFGHCYLIDNIIHNIREIDKLIKNDKANEIMDQIRDTEEYHQYIALKAHRDIFKKHTKKSMIKQKNR